MDVDMEPKDDARAGADPDVNAWTRRCALRGATQREPERDT